MSHTPFFHRFSQHIQEKFINGNSGNKRKENE